MQERAPLYIATSSYIAAFDSHTGQGLWRTQLEAPSGARMSVLERGRVLYVGCYGILYALDAQTGKALWKNSLQGMGHLEIDLYFLGKRVTAA
jgi:outer membrane protein assembly factor BamB